LTKDDTLLYRVNASFQSNNSFRELASGENVFFAPVLKWNISPRTQVTLEVEYQRDLSIQDDQTLPFDGTRVIDDIPHSRNLGERNPQETENIFVGLNWSHQFNDDWSLKHQMAFKRNDVNLGYSLIPVAIDLVTRQVDRFAFRGNFVDDTVATILDLTGHFKTWGLEHTVLLGGDYYRFDSSDGAANNSDTLSNISLDNPVHPGTPGPLLEPNANPSTQGVDNYGFYLQDQIKLPYNFLVTGGIRYQYVHSVNSSGFGINASASTITTDDAVTPRVGLVWHPQSWLSLYSNYVENFGANTGKFAYVQGSDPAAGGTPLRPETAQQWEVGAKTEFFDGRLRTTLAYYDLTKQNVATTDPLHPFPFCAGNGCSIAAGEVNSHGPELDIQGEILPGWNVIATYANQNVHITKSEDGNVGNRLKFVPRNTGSVWSTYEVQKGDLKGFKIGGGVNLQDRAVDAGNIINSPGYALVSLLAGYSFEVGKSRITAQLNVDNLLNKDYFSNPSNYGSGVDVNFAIPRTFMGSIKVDY